MRKFYATVFCMVVMFASHAQIVINEFQPDNDRIEIKNLGNQTVNVGSYFLCSFPIYTQISSMTIVSGSTMLMPGQLLVVTGHPMEQADDELGLYTLPQYTNSSAMIDYVEWGFSGHTRSSVAVAAGIWSTGAFVAAPTTGQSWMYDGSGNAPADWFTGAPTFGAENAIACNAAAGILTPIFNPNICSAQGSTLQFSVSGNAGDIGIWLVTDLNGDIVISTNVSTIDFGGLSSGEYNVQHLSGFGTVLNTFLGDNINDPEGCFEITESITISYTSISAGGIDIVSPTVYCVGDGETDMLILAMIGQQGGNVSVVITDLAGDIVYVGSEAPADLDTYDAGDYQIQLVVADSELAELTVGNNINNLSGCFDVSESISFELIDVANCSCLAFAGSLIVSSQLVCLNSNSTSIFCDAIDMSVSNYMWVLVDGNGNVVEFTVDGELNFTGWSAGTYELIGLGYELLENFPEINAPLSNVTGCFDLTESLTIVLEEPIGGTLTVLGTDIFVSADPQVIFDLADEMGEELMYIICDIDDVILAVQTSNEYLFPALASYHIYAVSYSGTLNAVLGSNIDSISSDGCLALSSMLMVDIVSNIDELSAISLNCFPNPVEGPMVITFGETLSGSVEVFDSVGKMVFVRSINSDRLVLEFGMFEAGTYIVVVKSKGVGVGREIIVKQ
ncbi:MAG: T9SS type A sorting domain-containing protein [Cryomorphaceae bacterium]|nr:T9SS type A sorting domain-containing protein [Cryomorphaceae bacterium]